MWELLLLGVSSLYLPKKGIKFLYKIKENIALNKNCRKFKATSYHKWYYIYLYRNIPFAMLKWRLTT